MVTRKANFAISLFVISSRARIMYKFI